MVLLFGIIPFKMKYLGWFELALWAVSFVMGDFATKISLVLGLSGFLAFYGREVFDWCVDAVKGWKRRRDWGKPQPLILHGYQTTDRKGECIMKLITAIVNKEDSRNVCNELLKSKFYVTRLATTGGFLMAGNMTLLICTEDERVDDCINVISKCCKQRTEIVPGTATMGLGIESAMPMEVTVGGATVMVTNVERFEKL